MKQKILKITLFDLIIVAAPFLIMTVFLWIAQNKYLYHPSFNDDAYQRLASDDNDLYEEIYIEDGQFRYHGWGYKASEEASTLIYFGGNYESSETFMLTMKSTGQIDSISNCNVVMFDYPGYGLSEGKPHYNSILSMADSVWNYIDEDKFYGNKTIYVMRFSLGTGLATYVAARHDCGGLILLAPYDNGKNLYNSQLNIFHGLLSYLVRNPFPSDQSAAKVSSPVLIYASSDDEVIPYSLSVNINKAFENSEFVTLQGVKHEAIRESKNVFEGIKEFLTDAN